MNIIMPVLFIILAIICFLLALYEEREPVYDQDEEDISDNLIIVLLIFAMAFFFIAGVTTMFITFSYYSPATGGLVDTEPTTDYLYLGWVWIGLAFMPVYFLVEKITTRLGNLPNRE